MRASQGKALRNTAYRVRKRYRTATAALLAVGVAPVVVAALSVPTSAQTTADAQDLWQRQTLTGSWGGLRRQSGDAGIGLGGNVIAEMRADPVGGARNIATFESRVEAFVDLDLAKLIGWSGASFHANGYQIGGRGLSGNALDNLLTVSGIEALPSTRLFDFWLQQNFAGDRVSLRAGQIAADDEFLISRTGAPFINATFGWPGILANDLPSGGPVYPLATPGVRLRAAPGDGLSLSAAAFNGDPAPPGPGNPQARDPHGLNFRIGEGGVFAIAEGAWKFTGEPRPGIIKLGGWYDSGDFADQRFAASGRPLASPSSDGIPAIRRGDWGFYGVWDQRLWPRDGSADKGLSAFVRLSGAPADRNLISFYADAGGTYKGLWPGRADDTLGLAAGYALIGGAARGFDRDLDFLTGANQPVRDFEAVVEVTYQARIAPWLVLQPDLQWVVHPGGNTAISGGAAAGRAIPNALVLGVRSSVAF